MAVYVYRTADGALVSWCPNDTDPVASDPQLAASGYAKLSGQPPLDATHVWDTTNKIVAVIAALKSIPSVIAFWRRFTTAEREAIENSYLTGTQATKNAIGAFFRYVQAANGVDCNDAYVQAKVQQLETAGIIAAGRAAQILV